MISTHILFLQHLLFPLISPYLGDLLSGAFQQHLSPLISPFKTCFSFLTNLTATSISTITHRPRARPESRSQQNFYLLYDLLHIVRSPYATFGFSSFQILNSNMTHNQFVHLRPTSRLNSTQNYSNYLPTYLSIMSCPPTPLNPFSITSHFPITPHTLPSIILVLVRLS